jgi:glycosyltransferase involved in cell wall biosynthesis
MSALTVVIIAQNEAPNIELCVRAVVDWAESVFVVDSFSTDATPELARAAGAEVIQHAFVDWASQRNWALEHLPLAMEWVLFLDADEQATEAFKQEVDEALARVESDVSAFYVYFDFVFLGRRLRHGYESPPVIRLIRRGKARWRGAGAREYCQVDGRIGSIKSRIWHEDHKGLSAWIEKQNRNATREAALLWQDDQAGEAAAQASERQLRVWIRNRLWNQLPLFFRPLIYFFYRYTLRGGFLDGKAGLVYTFLQGFWLNFVVDAKLYEARQCRDIVRSVGE